MSPSEEITPGWYGDPSGRFEARYHNGRTWTADVSSAGERYVDPHGTSPGAPGTSPPPTAHLGAARASMVLGIIAVALGWIPFVFVLGIATGTLAIVLGVVGLRRARPSGAGHGPAVAGIVTGSVGLLACVFGAVLSVIVWQAVDRYQYPNEHEVSITSCERDGSTAQLTGEVTNLGSDTGDFSIEVAFVRPGTDNPHRSARLSIDDVAAGDRATFEVERAVALDAVECRILRVDGPLPFGLVLD